MSKPIRLHPVDMTPALMQMLEDRGLIIRLCPGRHAQPASRGQAVDTAVYAADARYGPHKLLAVTINHTTFAGFGVHPDNEEFLLIGRPQAKPLYLVIALSPADALNHKLATGTVSGKDFVALRVRYNDAEVSFFTMLKGVQHGDATVEGDGEPPSFYVTEPRDLGTEKTPFGDYHLQIAD